MKILPYNWNIKIKGCGVVTMKELACIWKEKLKYFLLKYCYFNLIFDTRLYIRLARFSNMTVMSRKFHFEQKKNVSSIVAQRP